MQPEQIPLDQIRNDHAIIYFYMPDQRCPIFAKRY